MSTEQKFCYPKPEVQVKQGKLLGMIKGSGFVSTYVAYLGIPYAAPPIGELRFKDPQPPACWEGVRYAKDMECNMSAQLERFSEIVIGSEDCLYLNVYVPCSLHKSNPQKAVMVWIHGGAFLRGNGNIENTRPDYFMDKDVILVSINYRLGVLGFLNLYHEEAYGNQGLKDQVAALKWIKENIAVFGGNPDNITVFGCGAGAISTHLLTLSPLSKDLVHKAILQSGVAFCEWAVRTEQPEAFKLALLLGYDSMNPEEIAKFLRECPFEILVQMESNVVTENERRIRKITFGPTMDKESPNSFIPAEIKCLLDEGNSIPLLLGHTSHEYLGYLTDLTQENLDKISAQLPLYVENLLRVTSLPPQHIGTYVSIHLDMYQTHMGNMEFNRHNLDRIINYMSEIHYNMSIRSVAYVRSLQKNVDTYLYYFDYAGEEAKLIGRPNQDLHGISHGDELVYLFYIPCYKRHNFAPPKKDSLDYKMICMITNMWSNFAKTGKPNYECIKHTILWTSLNGQNMLIYFRFSDILPALQRNMVCINACHEYCLNRH